MFNPRENILFTLFLHAHFMTFMIFFRIPFRSTILFRIPGLKTIYVG